MCADGDSVRSAAADRMNLSTKRDQTERTAWRGKRRKIAPFVGGDIVFDELVERVLMDIGRETAGDIDLAVQCRNADMRAAYRHAGQIAPASRLRVEFLEQRRILPAQG